jgi:enamine deaminase RidA (YjgF/YER057c/UK114 family)
MQIRKELHSPLSAQADHPDSRALQVGDFILIPLQTAAEDRIGTGIAKETRSCMNRIAAFLREADLTAGYLSRLTVYYVNPAEEAAIQKAAEACLKERPWPAFSMVGAAFLPHGAAVAMEALAIDTRMAEQQSETGEAQSGGCEGCSGCSRRK